MKYVKLIAKLNTWFKAGTEVFHYDYLLSEKRRVTLEEWNQALKDGPEGGDGGICVRGIRVCEEGYEQQKDCLNCQPGEEREDGEYCCTDEFELVEIIEEG
jgi:hypothetical protein